MELGIKGKTALVMGASQGLGEACARCLAKEGANVIISARRKNMLQKVSESIVALGGKSDFVVCDLFDSSSRENFCQFIKKLERIDIIVANSGGPAPAKAPGIESQVWIKEFDAMVLGLIEIIDTAYTLMREAKFGRIIVIGSSGMIIPIPKLAVSNTLRSAVGGYVKTLAEQAAPHGITCNMVLPGRVETARTKAIDLATAKSMNITEEQAKLASISAIPTGRYGSPEEFGSVVTFLASEQAAYITGSQIRVDGGAIKSIG